MISPLHHRYDIEENEWTALPPMKNGRGNHASVIHAGYMYIIGGQDETSVLKSVEYYAPQIDQWSMAAPMNKP